MAACRRTSARPRASTASPPIRKTPTGRPILGISTSEALAVCRGTSARPRASTASPPIRELHGRNQHLEDCCRRPSNISLAIHVDKAKITVPLLLAALFYDLTPDKTVTISSQSERRERVVAKMKSPTFVLAAADAWSSSRRSNLAASLGSGPSHRSGSTAHDHNAVAATPHHCAWSRPASRRQRTRSAYRNRQRPLRPRKRRSLGATSSSRSRPGRPIATPRYRRSRRPCSQSPDQIKYRRQIPIG